MLLPHLLLIMLLEEVVAGDGQSGHQHNKLVKIHLVVLVGIQVVHDFLHQHRIFLGLQRGERKHFILCLPTNENMAFRVQTQQCGHGRRERSRQLLSCCYS